MYDYIFSSLVIKETKVHIMLETGAININSLRYLFEHAIDSWFLTLNLDEKLAGFLKVIGKIQDLRQHFFV